MFSTSLISNSSSSDIYRTKHGECQKLNTTNYLEWATGMEFTLKDENLWDLTQGNEHCPAPVYHASGQNVSIPQSHEGPNRFNPPNSSSSSNETIYVRSCRQTQDRSSSSRDSNDEDAEGGQCHVRSQQPEIPKPSLPPTLHVSNQEKIDDFNKRANQAASAIFCSLTTRIQPYVRDPREPQQLWKALERFNSVRNPSGAIHVRMQFMKDKCRQGESIADYIGRLISYQTQLAYTNEPLSDRNLVAQILYTLPPKYKGIKRHITDKPADDQTVDYVLDTLLEFEKSSQAGQPETQAMWLHTSHASQPPLPNSNCHFSNPPSHSFKREIHRGKFNKRRPHTSNQKLSVTCWYCLKSGYKEIDCCTKKRSLELKSKKLSTANSSAFMSVTSNYFFEDPVSQPSSFNPNSFQSLHPFSSSFMMR